MAHILTQNLYYNYYYPNLKYQVLGYMDLLGKGLRNYPRTVKPQTLASRGAVGFRALGFTLRSWAPQINLDIKIGILYAPTSYFYRPLCPVSMSFSILVI